MNNFREYCLSRPTDSLNVDDLLERALDGELSPLEGALVDFFSELTVKSPESGASVPAKRASVLGGDSIEEKKFA